MTGAGAEVGIDVELKVVILIFSNTIKRPQGKIGHQVCSSRNAQPPRRLPSRSAWPPLASAHFTILALKMGVSLRYQANLNPFFNLYFTVISHD